ncbi:MAG: DUF192 domain-containing protein [Hyphomonadaceae bacterium]
MLSNSIRSLICLAAVSLATFAVPAEAQTLSSLEVRSGETVQTLQVNLTKASIRDGVALTDQNIANADGGILLDLFDATAIAISSAPASTTLDLVFVSPTGTVTMIAHNAAPGSQNTIDFNGPTPLILQLAGGQARALGLNPGDTVSHELLGNTEAEGE